MLNMYSLLIFIWIPYISCQTTWSAPYFHDDQSYMAEGVRIVSNAELTQIAAIEEIPVPFVIATLMYSGDGPVIADTFDAGSDNELGISIGQREDNLYTVSVNNLQDYERISFNMYRFSIFVAATGQRRSIQLHILNKVDTPPSIEYNGPCEIDELQPIDTITGCTFNVYVVEGFEYDFLGLNWTNEITPILDAAEDALFGFELDQILNDESLQNRYFHLKLKAVLLYEVKPFYNFRTTFTNSAGNMSSILTIVELLDVPNKEPVWVRPPAIQTFKEKEYQDFTVEAMDGDLGIDGDLEFDLVFEADDQEENEKLIFLEKSTTVKNTAIIIIPGIDRDELQKEIFRFDIIAYKMDGDKRLASSSSGIIVIQDKNDQFPNITMLDKNGEDVEEIEIWEERFTTLDIDKIIVHDRDLEQNAAYEVFLDHEGTKNYSAPFNIVPRNGYQRSEFFKIDVLHNELLDYEETDWRSFEIIMVAQETDTEDLQRDSKKLRIKILNWNDELPIFDSSDEGYEKSVPENVGKDVSLIQVKATDTEEGDEVIHSIVGSNLAEKLYIDEETGEIWTNIENAFDFEKQEEVIFQVMAKDTLITEGAEEFEVIHNVYAQVTLKILDINDETPQIKMPTLAPEITENVVGGTIVTNEIEASDLDKTAILKFSIDWETSIATKWGKEVTEKELYQKCFRITEIIQTGTTVPTVKGKLSVNEDFINEGYAIDYEEFDVLYLTIVVNDTEQDIGEGITSAQLTVRIVDENDNRPEFEETTLEIERNVLEAALANTQIGTIFAEDIDGPGNNEIFYLIKPTINVDDEIQIPDNWITIDQKGVLRVDADKAIDCDVPAREFLEYTIYLTDGKNTNEGNIKIKIIDTNNKVPVIEDFDNDVPVYEKITKNGFVITTIHATDLDRDEDHRSISYLIASTYDKAGFYFEIDRLTGVLTVQLNGASTLDYDEGDKTYNIPIEIYDSDLNAANHETTTVRVILVDVNDHAPEFNEHYSPSIEEDAEIGADVQVFCASDLDSGDNKLISFTLNSIKYPDGVTDAPELFEMEDTENADCTLLKVKSSLRGHYGIWQVTITAKDGGDSDILGVQNTTETFNVEITPVNFNKPEIVYPKGESIRLSDIQGNNVPLKDIKEETLRPFEAKDDDGGVFGEIVFQITPTAGQDADDADFFRFEPNDTKTAHLQLTKGIGDRKLFFITVTAHDGGALTSDPMNLKITFVNIDGAPYFEIQEDFAFFKEKEAGLDQSYILPEGKDPTNEGLEEAQYSPVFYFLADLESSKYFSLDHETRELTLNQELDRNENEKHTLKIILSRSDESPPNNPPNESILTLEILVTAADAPTVDPTKPTIFFPFTNSLRLLAGQRTGVVVDVTSTQIRSFEAFGRNADMSSSDIIFKISNVPGEAEDAEYFDFVSMGKTLSNLILVQEADHENPYHIQITAQDSQGEESEPFNLKITFVDMIGTPRFEQENDLIYIHENQTGLAESYEIPSAFEPRNEGLDDVTTFEKIYYFIDTSYNAADASKFALDKESRMLTLRSMLDREQQDTYDIRIIVSRSSSSAPSNPSTQATLFLTIMVTDINDNPPVFERDVYGVGITSTDRVGKILITANAIDLDLNENIKYRIPEETYRPIGDGIDGVAVTSFDVTTIDNSANIILNFVPRTTMTGHFEFQIEASDNDNVHQMTALVKIYIIADSNRVTFVFANSVDDIEENENFQFMIDLFSEKFGYECWVDETEPATNSNGIPLENVTNVKVHFIQNNEAIPAETIQRIASDVVFVSQLKTVLAQRQLFLQEIPSEDLEDVTNKAELLQTILIVLSVVLGILCAVLIIAFFIRTRNLRRQLKALSTVDFGSTSSNLNRREAPTTNVFSVEGSNPVLNNSNLKPEFDNASIHSDESDFAGIHNDPTFQNRRESMNPELIEQIRRKSINPMVNGKANGIDSNL